MTIEAGVRVAFLLATCPALASACAPGAPAAASVQGELTVLIADHEDGHAETQHLVTLPSGERERIVFARDPAIASGTPIRAWGTRRADGALVVSVYDVDAPGGTTDERRSDLQAGTPLPGRSFAFVLLDTGGGVNVTAPHATQEMFDAGYFAANKGSIRRYYQEASFGLQDITGVVIGPLSFSPASTCDPDGALALRAQVDAMVGGPSANYLWYFGSRQAGCAWTGLATLGSPARPTRDTWFNASTSCVVLAQEPGHNFGMQHSSAISCRGKTLADTPDGACTHSEYGDPFDPMGSGCRHMNAWQKQYQGWLGGCNSVRLSESGTFTLLPLESGCNGIQVLQIPMPHTRTFSYTSALAPGTTSDELTYYYVELRSQPAGFDQGLAPQVQVRVGGDYRPPSQSGLHTWLLDMSPGTASFSDAAMTVGQTFADPAGGVTITATSVSAASATIAVTIDNGQGAPTCLDGTTLAPPGPPSCEGTGAGGSAGGSGGQSGGAGAVGGGESAADASVGDAGSGGSGGNAGSDAGQTAGDPPSGCACRAEEVTLNWKWSAVWFAAYLAVLSSRRRRAPRRVLGTLLGLSLLLACASGERVSVGMGGMGGESAAGAGGATSGAGGAPAGAGGAVAGAAGATGAAGTAGATGGTAGGTAGTAGAPGGTSWSCLEAAGTLCFCDRGDGGSASACSAGWTCCFVGPTSCECFDDDEASCQATIAGNAMLTRVASCPS